MLSCFVGIPHQAKAPDHDKAIALVRAYHLVEHLCKQ
jgi:hypothetical protein